MAEPIVVRVWEDTKDGDASFETTLELNPEYATESGPQYCGEIEVSGRKVWITIN